MSIPISQHLSLDEFACHDGTPYPAEWIAERLTPLCTVLEAVREGCGARPITILSGYRTPVHNAELRAADGSGTGVASQSQHLYGRAADIRVEGMAPSDVHQVVLTLYRARRIVIGGLGIYPGWVHVDIREQEPMGHLARWTGAGV